MISTIRQTHYQMNTLSSNIFKDQKHQRSQLKAVSTKCVNPIPPQPFQATNPCPHRMCCHTYPMPSNLRHQRHTKYVHPMPQPHVAPVGSSCQPTPLIATNTNSPCPTKSQATHPSPRRNKHAHPTNPCYIKYVDDMSQLPF